MTRQAIAIGVLIASVAHAHAVGYHKRLSLVVSRSGVDGLLVMDVDTGENARLLRAQADLDHDGKLSERETAALKQKLVSMATRRLSLNVSSYALTVVPADVKVSLREDRSVSDSGVSVAIVLQAKFPQAATPGLALQLRDESPDRSEIAVDVSASSSDGGSLVLAHQDLPSSQLLEVRLPAL